MKHYATLLKEKEGWFLKIIQVDIENEEMIIIAKKGPMKTKPAESTIDKLLEKHGLPKQTAIFLV